MRAGRFMELPAHVLTVSTPTPHASQVTPPTTPSLELRAGELMEPLADISTFSTPHHTSHLPQLARPISHHPPSLSNPSWGFMEPPVTLATFSTPPIHHTWPIPPPTTLPQCQMRA